MDGGMTEPDRLASPETIAVVDGEMSIPLDNGTAVLIANLLAAKGICRHFGGIQQALNKIAQGDIEAMITVVRLAMNVRAGADAIALEDRVFRTGVLRLTAPLTEYLLVLANGGKQIGTEPPGEPEQGSG